MEKINIDSLQLSELSNDELESTNGGMIEYAICALIGVAVYFCARWFGRKHAE
jgi:lactobin A/cerein 7B family class IIb bacteriocin